MRLGVQCEGSVRDPIRLAALVLVNLAARPGCLGNRAETAGYPPGSARRFVFPCLQFFPPCPVDNGTVRLQSRRYPPGMLPRIDSAPAPRRARAAVALREGIELARCAAQLLAWTAREPGGRMLADAVLEALDEAARRLAD